MCLELLHKSYYIIRLFERGEKNNMIIAIDGVAGSGKSSTAKKLADKLGFNYFSTGKMYRAITCYAINNSLIKWKKNIP